MIIRVFPRRTALTPTDEYAFVGDPPMIRPEADEVHISVTFTWDLPRAERLVEAWRQYYPVVKIGGPAAGSRADGFTPGMYVKEGVTFTSRGCNNQCPWCLVPEREGKLRQLVIRDGNIVNDNNLLQCNRDHIAQVFDMLRHQRHAAVFSGGLDARLIDNWVAEELRSLRVEQLFLAADTDGALRPLERAVQRLKLDRHKLRCYVLLGFNESLADGEARLKAVWEIGCMPFAQLYQPKDHHIDYPQEWRDLARTWSRPAAMVTLMGAVRC